MGSRLTGESGWSCILTMRDCGPASAVTLVRFQDILNCVLLSTSKAGVVGGVGGTVRDAKNYSTNQHKCTAYHTQ